MIRMYLSVVIVINNLLAVSYCQRTKYSFLKCVVMFRSILLSELLKAKISVHTALQFSGLLKKNIAFHTVCYTEERRETEGDSGDTQRLTSSCMAAQLPECNCNNSNTSAVMLDSFQTRSCNCRLIYATRNQRGLASARVHLGYDFHSEAVNC